MTNKWICCINALQKRILFSDTSVLKIDRFESFISDSRNCLICFQASSPWQNINQDSRKLIFDFCQRSYWIVNCCYRLLPSNWITWKSNKLVYDLDVTVCYQIKNVDKNRIWAFDCLDLCSVRAKKLKSILNSYENHLWMIWICQF